MRSLLTDEDKLQSRITGSDRVIVGLKSTVHDLERQCKHVTAHDSSVERDVTELRRQLQDVAEVRRQLRAVELDRSQLQKALNDIRGDTDKQQKVGRCSFTFVVGVVQNCQRYQKHTLL